MYPNLGVLQGISPLFPTFPKSSINYPNWYPIGILLVSYWCPIGVLLVSYWYHFSSMSLLPLTITIPSYTFHTLFV